MLTPLNPYLVQISRGVNTAKRLEKIAAQFHDDVEIVKSASEARELVIDEVFDMCKKAGAISAKALTAGDAALKGLGWGVGLGVPAIGVGAYLSHKSEDATADMRNKILQTGLGLAGIGAGLYGLHRLANQGEKQASSSDDKYAELVEKLAAVDHVESTLAKASLEKLSGDAAKLAREVRTLNRAYGVQLLHEAMYR